MLFEEIDRLQKIDRFIRLNNKVTPEDLVLVGQLENIDEVKSIQL